MTLNLNCEQAARLLSEAMDRPLSLAEKLALKAHLFLCDMCVNYENQLAVLRQIVKSWHEKAVSALSAGLSKEAKERIKLRVRGPA